MPFWHKVKVITMEHSDSDSRQGGKELGDLSEIISGSNGADPISISDTWRGIVFDLYGM